MDMKKGLTQDIIDECKKQHLLRNQAAYVLATARWETAGTMLPVKEAYYLGKKAENWRKSNLRYYPWYGRGLVQLTWKDNYIKAGKKLGKDFITNPDVVMENENTVAICVRGMKEGWFTGKKLKHYLTLRKSEWRQARRIVNGMDKADEIADLAVKYDEILKDMGYGVDKPLSKSRTIRGGTLAATGGAAVLVEPVNEAIKVVVGTQDKFSSGSVVQMIMGGVVIAGALFALYARWDDAGRPKFWK